MIQLVVGLAIGLLSIIGALIVLYLRSIKSCIHKSNQRVETARADVTGLEKDFRDCKLDCDRTFVSAELFLRETGYTRRSLETLTASVNRMEGKLTVVDQLPQICGDISREIVKEMRNGESNAH
ncbi:MAG: hypothetical protein ACYTEQ_21585 [Planctomycetota bacterium]|jgi:hypothetical protein